MGEIKMKTLSQILVLALLTLGSCTSSLYTGAEYDDLYYLPSDKPVAKSNSSVNDKITEGTLKNKDYYDNIYAADTLVSDQYSDAVNYDNQVNNSNYSNGEGFDYYNDYPYSNRLRMFYGNYFNPYWRDPFYLDYGMGLGMGYGYGMGYGMDYGMGYGMGYGGLYGDYYGGYPGMYYGGYYGNYYGGYYGGSFFGSGLYGGYPMLLRESNTKYGRPERPSNLSSRWNSTVGEVGSARRNSSISSGTLIAGGRSAGSQVVATSQRRAVSSGVNSQAVNQVNGKAVQVQTKGNYTRSVNSVQRNTTNVKPAYNSVNRAYTPSYNNPRMSTRPSYNNSRVSEGVNSSANRNGVTNNSRVYNNAGSVRQSYQNSYNNVRSNSSGSSVQRRSNSPSGYYIQSGQPRSGSSRSSSSYSLPSRGSYSSGFSGGSSSGRSSSSYSSGSSGSVSSGSYSSGSSSGSSSSSRSSSGSSSSRR
jgi:hypothetical protein